MNRNHLRWLINPLFLLATVTCNNEPLQGGMCQSGVDTDGDGLNDDVECRIGSDPNNPDTNGDGLSDGDAYNLGLDPTKLDFDGDGVPDVVEVRYPKICVAEDRNSQRRPPQVCTAGSDCQAGEDCLGLDPTKQDSDGDGVLDKDEDPNLDGTIDFATGETDPRLWDTDGDGQNDANSGAGICRPDGLGMVVQKGLGPIQLGYDPVFGTAKDVTAVTMNRTSTVVDDAVTGVAGLVSVQNTPTGSTDVRGDSQSFETAITTKLGSGAVGIFLGRAFTTHEDLPGVRSTYQYTAAAATSASAIRDTLVQTLTGGTPPGGATAGSGNTVFFVDVTTVRRTTGLDDLIVVVSPQPQYNDVTQATAIRVDDLSNATGVADGARTLDHACQGIIANRLPIADFLWTVDTSGSMSAKEARIGVAATTFAKKLGAAGVDFRVGIFQADSSGTLSLTAAQTTGTAADDNAATFPTNGWKNGFKFLSGTTPNADLWMCRFVTTTAAGTDGYCPTDGSGTADPWFPFKLGNKSNEEPVAAAVRVNDTFKKNAGNANPDIQWRANVTKAAFFVTDEPTTNTTSTTDANDWNRYFSTTNNPDTNTPWGATYGTSVINGIAQYFQSNQILIYGIIPVYSTRSCTVSPNPDDLPRCVVEAGNGATVDMAQANTQSLVDAAMDRIANDIIGASSPIVLKLSPITHTIKVTVRGANVPRSRSDGFDYNQNSKSIVFYGNFESVFQMLEMTPLFDGGSTAV